MPRGKSGQWVSSGEHKRVNSGERQGLAQRLMPFLLGGLRAPLPQSIDLPSQQQEPSR
jgi:hypothetical protein